MTQTEQRARELVSRSATLTNDEWLQMVDDLLATIEHNATASAIAKEGIMSEKNWYAVLSGEGSIGTWSMHCVTDIGIKRILTRERCGGDRWANAYYKPHGVGDVGIDYDTGVPRGGVFVGNRRYWDQ